MRQSLGPAWSNMTCLGCGQPTLQGMIDKNGHPYVSCTLCRFRVLGATVEILGGLKFIGEVLAQPSGRAAWIKARQLAAGETTAVPVPEVVNVPAA